MGSRVWLVPALVSLESGLGLELGRERERELELALELEPELVLG